MFLLYFVVLSKCFQPLLQVTGEDGAPVGARKLFMKELEKQEEIARKRRELEALERQLVVIRKKDVKK